MVNGNGWVEYGVGSREGEGADLVKMTQSLMDNSKDTTILKFS